MRLFLTTILVAVSVAAFAQTPDPAPEAEKSEADKLLERIDEAIYYPSRAGVKDFRFRWKTGGTGVFEELNDDLYVAYAWKTPGHIRIEYVNGEGRRVGSLPEISKHPELVKVFKQLEGSIHALAQQLIVGAPYATVYRDYYKRVDKRVVNNKVEYDLVLTPKEKKHWTQIVIKVIEGLPRRITKTDARGDSLRVFHRFEKRDEKYLPIGLRVERNNQLVMDETYSYTRIDGLYVFNELTRASLSGDKTRETIRLERLEVNSGLPETYFTEAAKDSGDD